ncbi:short-chain dehydrogenase [Gemmatimonadota bacterium]
MHVDIIGRRILVLGGFGMVGHAICRDLLERQPARLTVSSLLREEAETARDDLQALFPEVPIEASWGNIFVREAFKDLSRNELLQDAEHRNLFLEDAFGDLNEESLQGQALYRLIADTRPDLVVDAINTATALAYQDVYLGSNEVLKAIRNGVREEVDDATVRLVATQYTPQLVRHVQVLYAAMRAAGTGMYIKVGTTGTGGMGLNIPYTHSEERPSRVLLSKSAMAGAHSMLLFLMGRTPDGPIIKEVKPAAVIAWKGIGAGPVMKHHHPIPLFDVTPEEAVEPAGELIMSLPEDDFRRLGDDRVLESVFIDTGENGFFSRGEFSVITTIGQMEFITPEEISSHVIREIMGGNTGFDIVNALDMGPTYRAGSMRESALEQLQALEDEHGIRSVAFEVLGPPRLSKLLFEAELLRRSAGTLGSIVATGIETLSADCLALIEEDTGFRSEIISIGIPILLPDGRLLRGPTIKIPPPRGLKSEPVEPANVEQWASDGWVDLRTENMVRWQERARAIIEETESIPPEETSSRFHHDRNYWRLDQPLDIGKTVGWIFIREDEGERMK